MKPILIVLYLLLNVSSVADDLCRKWFEASRIPKGPECLNKCAVLSTGMGTFMCPNLCKQLCEDNSLSKKLLEQIAYYPGLNKKERQLISEHPKEAVEVYNQKNKAESESQKTFGRDSSDDESDAFRHFLWAALLTKELGANLAKEFLDAHESEDSSENPSKAMDLANNRAGILAAEKLINSGKFSLDAVKQEALKGIKDGTLIVLKPQGAGK